MSGTTDILQAANLLSCSISGFRFPGDWSVHGFRRAFGGLFAAIGDGEGLFIEEV
jgi:hypothetical protein